MANRVEDFFSSIAGETATDKDIDNVIAAYPDFRRIEGIETIIKNLIRWFWIVKGTYVMDPTFGNSLQNYLFEPQDIVTLEEIRQAVDQTIRETKTNAKIDYQVAFYRNRKAFRVDLIVTYKGRTETIPVTIDEGILDERV